MRKFYPHFRDRKPGLHRLKYLPQITLRLTGRADSSLDLPDSKVDAFNCCIGLPPDFLTQPGDQSRPTFQTSPRRSAWVWAEVAFAPCRGFA